MEFDRISAVQLAADSYDLTTIEIVKDELKLTTADDDPWLARAITQASALVGQYCNRVFPVESVRDTFTPRREHYCWAIRGQRVLQLMRWPVTNAFSVVQHTSPTETATLVQGTDFLLDASTGQLTRLDLNSYLTKPWEAWPVIVDYDTGYEDTPQDVVAGVLRLVVGRWHARSRDPLLLERVTPGVGTDRWWVGGPKQGGSLPAEVAGMLQQYRVPVGM